MFLLAFFGFLRCSEFTSTSTTFDPSAHPCVSDITLHSPDTLIFSLKRSKTNQSGPAVPIFLFRLNSPLSPFESLQKLIHSKSGSHALPSSPLFITESGLVASRFWFHHHLRLILTKSGIDPTHYSGHSFRIGAASSASSQGVADHTIQLLGRWSSQAYRLYVRTNLPDLHHTQALISLAAARR